MDKNPFIEKTVIGENTVKCWCGKEIPKKRMLNHVLKEHSLEDMISFISKNQQVDLDVCK